MPVPRPLGFIIFNSEHGDFVHSYISRDTDYIARYCRHPSDAKLFKTRAYALSAIRKIIGENLDKVLTLGRLYSGANVVLLLRYSFDGEKLIESPLIPVDF